MNDAAVELALADEEATLSLGAALAELAPHGLVLLRGDLGAGKTTLVRGALRALGHGGAVKSPTYTLVEPYVVAGVKVHHFDLYRLGDADELDAIGFRDYLDDGALCFVEWPERAGDLLRGADVDVELALGAGGGRDAQLRAGTERGRERLAALCAGRASPARLR